jgi:hypothetical protein
MWRSLFLGPAKSCADLVPWHLLGRHEMRMTEQNPALLHNTDKGSYAAWHAKVSHSRGYGTSRVSRCHILPR